jgi:hypothetical protein
MSWKEYKRPNIYSLGFIPLIINDNYKIVYSVTIFHSLHVFDCFVFYFLCLINFYWKICGAHKVNYFFPIEFYLYIRTRDQILTSCLSGLSYLSLQLIHFFLTNTNILNKDRLHPYVFGHCSCYNEVD